MLNFLKKIYAYFFFNLFSVFPLENKVVFSNFSGKRYGDSPRSISEKLLEKDASIKQVWLYHDDKFSNIDKNIKLVKWGTISMIYELSTAKVWIDSHTKPIWVKKRKKQFYIETWHGGLGIKKIEGDAIDTLSKEEISRSKNNSKMIDLLISNSCWLTNIYKRAFWYKGKILECGFPKNDILFKYSSSLIKDVKKSLNIDEKTKIVLYAPTFRKTNTIKPYQMNFESLCKALETRFSGKWIVLLRLHPLSQNLSKMICNNSTDIVDVTFYDDMQKLIIASDVFITDYSSGIFDFMILKKPAFIYATDYKTYLDDRGTYFSLEELPFPVSYNDNELFKKIATFNFESYQGEIQKYLNKVGLKEKGTATEIIINIILKKIYEEK